MGSVCLSSASILRCTSLTRIQNIILIIPTALEVIFSTGLVFINWGSGRRNLLLAAEGSVYFTLALLELLSDVLPAVRNNLSWFQTFDIGIGVASFLPIFFYTFFLFLFTSAELIETLPNRVKNVGRLALILFVPAIVIFNEVASFIGVSIRTIPAGTNVDPTSVVVVGFSGKHEESLWTFFTSVTLALLTAFQAAVFFFAFFRLYQALLHQRRIESKGDGKAHLIKGVGWIAAAAKLGAIETVVGYGGGGFGVALTRRIMRLLARACLIIGIVKGVDAVEDFRAIRSEFFKNEKQPTEFRSSRLRQFISNPRLSTFQQLSPTASAFHAAPRAPPSIPSSKSNSLVEIPYYLSHPQRQSQLIIQSALSGMAQFASIKEKNAKERVTVLYNDGAPTLQVRFSTLNFPSPALIVERVKSRPPSEWSVEAYRSKSRAEYMSQYEVDFNDNEKVDLELQLSQPRFQQEKAGSDISRNSMGSSVPSITDPYEIVTIERTLSQKAVQARVYQTPAAPANANNEPSPTTTTSIMVFAPLSPPPHIQTRAPKQAVPDPRIKSMSMKSMTDTLQAVHELADQFPGLPVLSRPPANQRVPSSTVWDEDGSVVDYPRGLIVAQAVGSPSQLTFGSRTRQSEGTMSSWGNSRHSSTVEFVQPVLVGQVPVSPGGGYPTNDLNDASYSEKPIDPFSDEEDRATEDEYRPSSQPIIVPVGKPLRQSVSINVIMDAAANVRKLSTPENLENTSPVTALSGYTQFTGMQERTPGDLGSALDTGKSRQFKPNQPPISPLEQPQQEQQSPRPQSEATSPEPKTADEKLARVAEWVDSTVSSASMHLQAQAETQVWEQARDIDNNSLQNLHDRGKSIDNLSIPWLKSTEMMEEDERKLTRVMTSPSSRRPQLSRLKAVGKAPRKLTPTPTHNTGPDHLRGSLHLEPIIIPPRDTDMPEAVQLEYGNLESTATGKGIRRDSEVLGMEDAVYVKQSTQEIISKLVM